MINARQQYDAICLQETFDTNVTDTISLRLAQKYSNIFTNIAPVASGTHLKFDDDLIITQDYV